MTQEIETPAVRQLAVVPTNMEIVDLAGLERRMHTLVAAQRLVKEAMHGALIEGEDYGHVGSAPRPSLWKPGAEKLLQLFHYGSRISSVETVREDGGHLSVTVTVAVFDRATGQTIADGTGSANTRESRYANRWVYRSDLPEGVDPSALESREFTGRTGGTYLKYLVGNDDLFTLHNTILKMATKRARVDAALTATATSGVFAQDLEDMDGDSRADVGEGGNAAQHRRTQRTTRRPAPAAQPAPNRWALTREETDRFWREAREQGVTADQVRDMLGGKALSGATRAEAMRAWAEFGNPPADAETGEIIDAEAMPAPDEAGDE